MAIRLLQGWLWLRMVPARAPGDALGPLWQSPPLAGRNPDAPGALQAWGCPTRQGPGMLRLPGSRELEMSRGASLARAAPPPGLCRSQG